MNQFSDLDLVEQALAGQDDALTQLIQRYLTPVYRFLYRFINDPAIAEDLTQETFVKAWKSLSGFDRQRVFKTWIFSIAKNTAIDFLRKKQSLTFSQLETGEEVLNFGDQIEDERPLADAILEKSQLATDVQAGLSQLPPKTRSIVLMHHQEERTFQEIADIMHESMNTVKSRYRRALQVLRGILHTYAPK